MHLLAESGGTKTQWYLYDAQGLQREFRTSGFNPNVQSATEIEAQQRADWGQELPVGLGLQLDFTVRVLGHQGTEAIVRGILTSLFPGLTLNLRTDMLAAALATCGDAPGIVCILGTGSNCCFWDGQKITGNLGSHGYLFSDEGSGADLGRAIVSAALNGELPHHIEHKFRDWAGKPFLEIRTEIYHSPKINAALAHYSRFLAEHLDDPTIRMMVVARFMAFLNRTVLRMRDYRQTPIHFVGSISEVYQAPLREALSMLQLAPASVTAAPGEKLLAYHVSKLKGEAH
ncbi:MAG: hypothetical protein IPP17_30700 [Bacteroidetes bacterium]|nr:hypothetical protein [Bacteroidota bacterium]